MGVRTLQAIKGTATSLLQYSLQILWQILLSPLILKMAGQETLGAYSMVMQVVGCRIILDFGLSVSVNRSMAFYSGKHSPELFDNAFKAGRMFLAISNALAGSVLIGAAFLLPKLFSLSTDIGFDFKASLLLFGCWTLIRGPIIIYQSALVARQNMASANVVAIVGNATRIFLSLALVSAGFGLTGLIFSAVVAEVFGDLLNRAIYLREYKHPGKWGVSASGEIFKEITSLGVQYWLVNLAFLYFYSNDSLIVGYLFGAAAASVYFTTKLPAFFAFQLAFKLSDNSASAISELLASGNIQRLRVIYLKLLRYSLLVGVPLAIGILCFNKSIISLWVGPAQYAGEYMSAGLALFAVTQILTHLNAAFMVASGNLCKWPLLAAGMAGVGFLLSILLGKNFGPQGVFIGIVLADIPLFYYLFRSATLLLGVNLREVVTEGLGAIYGVVVPLVFVGMLAKFFFLDSLLLRAIVIPGLFVVSWVILAYTVGLRSSEKHAVCELFKWKLCASSQ